MKMFRTFLRSALCSAVFASGAMVHAEGPSDGQVAARAAALEVAGAFSNDGFKLRDGYWSGAIAKGEAPVLALNLFAGNHYWFSVATTSAGTPVIELFDEAGRPVETEPWKDGQRAAAGFSAVASGPYFLRIRTGTGEAADFCVVYSYK